MHRASNGFLRHERSSSLADRPTIFHNSKSSTNIAKGGSPVKSIYELIKQDIKMPDGLLFRGKYVGNSKQKETRSVKSDGMPRALTAFKRKHPNIHERRNEVSKMKAYIPE
jgi:hypothetical protein